MKKLDPVPTPPSYIDIFEGIRDRKTGAAKAVLINNQAAIRNRYADYETRYATNSLHGIANSTLGGIRTELRSCYGRNKGMNDVKKAIRDAQPKGRLLWCPYCGATTPTTHDHYLPAEKFPEFAAHALNLVPACSRCNSTKDDDWLNAGARQYIHYYLDIIPPFPFLTANIITDAPAQAVGVIFSVQQAGMQAAAWQLIEAHFRKLKLIDLYISYSNDLITTILRSARSYMRAGGQNAADFLANEAVENAVLYGEHGWRAVLLREMSIHPDLDQWIAWL